MGGLVKSVFGGGGSKKASKRIAEANIRAAELSYEATMKEIELQEKMFQQVREDYEPWREAGVRALGHLESMAAGESVPEFRYGLQEHVESPGYQFQLAEGEKAINRAAAAGSGVHSGATLARLMEHGQGLAASDYDRGFDRALTSWQANRTRRNDRWNRHASLAGIGQQATGETARFGARTTDAIGRATREGAAHLGAGQIGAANALAQGQAAHDAAVRDNFWSIVGAGIGLL